MTKHSLSGRRVGGRVARLGARPVLEAMEARLLLATIVVNTTADDQTLDTTLSLREAIEVANGTLALSALSPTEQLQVTGAVTSPAPNTINFDIPGTGVHTIAPTTPLPTITNPVTINGYSQRESSPNMNGPGLRDNAVLRIQIAPTQARPDGLVITAGGSTIRGLIINGFNNGIDLQTNGGNTVAGNFIGTTPDGSARASSALDNAVLLQSSNNTIGGTAPADRNLLSGAGQAIRVPINPVADASNNVIEGNFLGTDATGTQEIPNLTNILIESGSGDRIGGTATGAGNLITGSLTQGIFIYLGGPVAGEGLNSNGGHVIQGNLIGTDVTGTAVPANAKMLTGIYIIPRFGTLATTVNPRPITIGGTAAGAANVIAGIGGAAIDLRYPPEFVAPSFIQGNFIGTDRTGTRNLGNRGDGIDLGRNLRNVTITSNTIAYNNAGAVVPGGETGNLIVNNSIHDNDGGNPGILRDTDIGPAVPNLTSATVSGATTTVLGTVRGAVGSIIRVDLYANAPPPTGFTVQGQTPVKTLNVLIRADGTGAFTTSFPSVPSQPLITATATTLSNTTSPFSEPAQPPLGSVADLAVTVTDAPDPVAAGGTLTYTINLTNKGPGASQTVRLTDALPAGTTFVSFTAPMGWTTTKPAVGGTGTVTATAPDPVANGASLTFKLVVRVAKGTPGGTKINDTARVTTSTTDPVASNNSAVATTTVRTVTPATADLAVTLAGTPKVVPLRGKLSYTIKVVNLGPNTANGLVVTDTLPPGVQVVSAGGGISGEGNTLIFSRMGLARGASATFTIVVRPTNAGMITDTVRARSLTPDPVAGNNRASMSTTVVAPSLSLIQFAVSSLTATQSDGTATIVVTRSGGLDQAVSARFSVLGGTAQVGSDYTVVTPQTLTFAPGQTSVSIPIGIINDPKSDPAETVVLGLGGASGNATLGRQTSTLTIAGKTVVPTGAGPTVTGLQRFGYHWMPTRLVLTFSEALDPARAQDVNNYILIAPGRDHRLGTADDQVVGIVSATYDPATRTVTLAPDRRLYLYDRYVLRVIGTGPGGVADTSGHLLDGAGTGRAGSDFVTNFGREILVFTTRRGQIRDFGPNWLARVRTALAGSGGISNLSG